MHAWVRKTLMLTAALFLTAAAADARDPAPAPRRPPRGSLARQRLLQQRLRRITPGSLAKALRHSRNAWERLTPDERSSFRRRVLAFHRKSPAEQEKLIRHYENLFQMTAERRRAYRRRARWLKVVVRSFTPEQREALKQMPPDARARKLLDRKAFLIRRGVLSPAGATSQPTSMPAGSP